MWTGDRAGYRRDSSTDGGAGLVAVPWRVPAVERSRALHVQVISSVYSFAVCSVAYGTEPTTVQRTAYDKYRVLYCTAVQL